MSPCHGVPVTAFAPEPFGKFFLLERVAVGGMAEIFLAKSFAEGGFESLFVLKRILPHLGEDPSFVEMFVTEAKVSVGLQHPNIVRVFDFGKEGPHYFLLMEHIDGRDLRRVMRAYAHAGKPIPLSLALHMVAEACKGLHYAHTRTRPDGSPVGIVHRDVSPSNLLLSWDGEVKVADFGIARAEWVVGEEEASVKGKFEYMSPEQSTGGALDARSDVFSLGIILYELVTGKRAFKGETAVQTLQRLRDMAFEPVRSAAPDAPEAVAAVIDRALQARPEDRFQSARELGDALRRASDGLQGHRDDSLRDELSHSLRALFTAEIAADHLRLEHATEAALELLLAQQDAPTPVWGRWRGAFAAAAVGLLALGGGVVWMWSQDARPPAIDVASTGSLEFDLTPSARVFLSGRPAGEGETLSVGDLAPGDYELRIEADGYRTVIDTVRVTRGGATRVRRALDALAADPPVLRFESRPAGAAVWIDGHVVGATPFEWREGEPGKTYAYTIRLDGFEDQGGRTTELVAGKLVRVERVLGREDGASAPAVVAPTTSAGLAPDGVKPAEVKPPEEAKPPEVKPPAPEKPPAAGGTGSLKVTLVGANWATVFVDGKKIDKAAPFNAVALPVGEHTIHVENPALGVSQTQKVTVTAGGTATVRVVAQ
jgi:hypothetical protein